VSTYLTDYPSITETYTVTIDFTCPTSPLLLNDSPVTFSTPILYDLTYGITQTEVVSPTSIWPAGCGYYYKLAEVYDTSTVATPVHEHRITYDPVAA